VGHVVTLTLHLGVNDFPYSGPENTPRRIGTRQRKGGQPEAFSAPASGAITTHDVASILEAKYHLMEVYYEDTKAELAADLESGLANVLEARMNGAPASLDPFGKAIQKAEAKFKEYLSLQKFDTMGIPGVPTMASIKGINHRLKHPYSKKNPSRPSFIDTGTYQSSTHFWLDE